MIVQTIVEPMDRFSALVRMMPVIIEDSASVLSVKQTYMKRKDLYYMMTYPSRLFNTCYFKFSGVMIKCESCPKAPVK